jgi:uncharacterized repeat protein (TIGR02543 family)
LGTGDFTIEWVQYHEFDSSFNRYPRIFQIGTVAPPNTVVLGVSIETPSINSNTTFYYWVDKSFRSAYIIPSPTTNYKNNWVHFAITRKSEIMRIFMNGTQIGPNISGTYNINPTIDLTIANQNTKTKESAFKGYLYYLSILKGTALHNDGINPTFDVSYTYPTNYTILINSATIEDEGNNIIVNNVTTEQSPSFPTITYSVTYNNNVPIGATGVSGNVPLDSSSYIYDASVNVLGNTGELTILGYTFSGWNTSANGLGTTYLPSSTFSITGNITLYAIWNSIPQPSILRMSLYTNNSQVYYKPNSLSSGIGSVRTHRAKKYRT